MSLTMFVTDKKFGDFYLSRKIKATSNVIPRLPSPCVANIFLTNLDISSAMNVLTIDNISTYSGYQLNGPSKKFTYVNI